MSETDDEWERPVAVIGAIVLVLLGVSNFAGSECTEIIGKMYDGMIYLGDSLLVLGLAGGVVAFTANQIVASRKRRPAQRQHPVSDGTAGGFGGRDARPTQTHEQQQSSDRSLTLVAVKFFLVTVLVGGLLTLAGWWMVNTSGIQCASGFWSGFLSGRIPP